MSDPRPVPSFLSHIITDTPAESRSASAVGVNNVLELNVEMFASYDRSLATFQKHLRARCPVVMALFTGEGGTMLLFEPGCSAPIVAPSPPIEYSLCKSVAHSIMGIYQVLAPVVAHANKDQSWVAQLKTWRVKLESARDSMKDIENIPADTIDNMNKLIDYNLQFINRVLAAGDFTYADMHSFCNSAVSSLVDPLMARAAEKQVSHWCGVVEEWKKRLGDTLFNQMYAVVNSLYVTRQNNVLYTILLQYMGVDAIRSRLLLFETSQFTTTPEQMFDVLTRTLADRALGEIFFNSYFLMDAELLNTHARVAIQQRASATGGAVLLPPEAPFDTHDLPWSTTNQQGYGPANFFDALKHGNQDSIQHVPGASQCPFKKHQQQQLQQHQQHHK